MKKIGITGCIGSGKSLVCKIFETYGIPVFDADRETKKLYISNAELKAELIHHFGENVYTAEQMLDRKYLAQIVFNDPEKLKLLNSIVHPYTKMQSNNWFKEQQGAPFALKEAALLFESQANEGLDHVICVVAPEEVRIQRVITRDQVAREEVLKRMQSQWTQEQKQTKSDFIIHNDGIAELLPQVDAIYNELK